MSQKSNAVYQDQNNTTLTTGDGMEMINDMLMSWVEGQLFDMEIAFKFMSQVRQIKLSIHKFQYIFIPSELFNLTHGMAGTDDFLTENTLYIFIDL